MITFIVTYDDRVSKIPLSCTFCTLNPPFIKTPVLCVSVVSGLFVFSASVSSQSLVSQAAYYTPQEVNAYALQYYGSQLQTVTSQFAKQYQLLQKQQQQQLALAKAEAEKKAAKARQVAVRKPTVNASGKVLKTASTTSLAYAPLKEGSHTFYAGQCTRYVASQKTIPWGGNAGEWLNNAKAEGYETSTAPKAGAILVTNESSTGHVAIVEEVKGDKMIVSEMNYAGWGKVTKREIPLDSSKIKGYITDARVAS